MNANPFGTMIDNGTAQRIDAACFIDGDDDEYVVEFFAVPGSIFRSCYNRRTTCNDFEWVPVGWEFDRLMAMHTALHFSI